MRATGLAGIRRWLGSVRGEEGRGEGGLGRSRPGGRAGSPSAPASRAGGRKVLPTATRKTPPSHLADLTEAQQSPRRAVQEQPSSFYAQDGPRPGRARRAQIRPRSSRLCCAAEREPTRPLPLPSRRQLVARQTYELENNTTSAERWRARYSTCEARRLAIERETEWCVWVELADFQRGAWRPRPSAAVPLRQPS
jgi:hypothetical protein